MGQRCFANSSAFCCSRLPDRFCTFLGQKFPSLTFGCFSLCSASLSSLILSFELSSVTDMLHQLSEINMTEWDAAFASAELELHNMFECSQTSDFLHSNSTVTSGKFLSLGHMPHAYTHPNANYEECIFEHKTLGLALPAHQSM